MAAPLFKPFRALGYITENVPFAVSRKGKETYVTVSVGKAWQVYNCAKLTLALVGPQLHGDVRALACKNDLTFAAVGGDIVECKRVHRSGTYSGAHSGPVRQLLLLGDLLLSLGERDGRLAVWAVGQYDKPQRVIELGADFQPAVLCHPDTYLNKVLVGSGAAGGRMQLWNFRTGSMLYEFKGWGSAVRSLAPSPALDVVAVGLADGRAVLHNVRTDEEIVIFANASGSGLGADRLLGGGAGSAAASAAASGGPVTALSFRTGAGVPLLAAGGGGGALTVWNLEERRLHTVVRDAHAAGLLSLHFFPGEPLLMSAASDNSIKHWVFDSAEAAPRLLRFRAGHHAPPTVIKHYGQGGLRLLSAGCDRAFRVFSVHQDQQSRELSQGHTERRAKRLKLSREDLLLERVVDMDACEVRERDWANVVTAHEGDPAAYTWRLAHFTLGDHVLVPPEEELCGSPAAPVTSVAISRCGNFGIVGSASGRLDRYNLQSGAHRGAYHRKRAQAPPLGQQQQQANGRGRRAGPTPPVPAHSGAVVGCASDACNRLLVSAGLDGALRVWDFRAQTCKAEVSLGGPASRLVLHAGSGLAAVALADASIRMYDIEAVRLVRRFRGHSDRITGLHLSADCRWLLSAAMDGTLRVWDVPAATCLQVLKLGAPVTSLSLSPALDLLATTHVNRRGIYLWSNQVLFGPPAAITHSEQPVSVSVVRAALPSVGGSRGPEQGQEQGYEEEEEDEDGLDSDEEGEEARRVEEAAARLATAAADGDGEAGPAPYERRDPVSGAPLPLAPELVTLSLLPRSQWDSLAHIEVIKARNKPLQPPKKPEAAPFFLPTLPGLEPNPVFDLAAGAGAGAGQGADTGGDTGADGEQQGPQPASEDADGSEDGVEGGTETGEGSDGEEGAAREGGAGSRVVRRRGRKAGGGGAGGGGGGPPVSRLVRLLRRAAGGGGEECAAVMAALRGMSPTAIDRELRAMTVLEGGSSEAQEEADLGALLDVLAASLEARRDFEFCQALLSVVVAQHGDAIAARPALAARASRLRALVAGGWARLDGLLQHVRCMVGFFGNLQ